MTAAKTQARRRKRVGWVLGGRPGRSRERSAMAWMERPADGGAGADQFPRAL